MMRGKEGGTAECTHTHRRTGQGALSLLLLLLLLLVLPATTLRPCFFSSFPSAAHVLASAPASGGRRSGTRCGMCVGWGGHACVSVCDRRETVGGRGKKKSAENQPRGRSKERAAAPANDLSPPRTERGRPDLDEWWLASTCLGESQLAWDEPDDARALTASRPSRSPTLPPPPSHIGWSLWSLLVFTLAGGSALDESRGDALLHLQSKGKQTKAKEGGGGGEDALLPWCRVPLRRLEKAV